MLKAIAFPFIALMLIFSILAPSVISLVDKDGAIAVLVDSNDEENNQEKESKKKFEEKDLFLHGLVTTGNFLHKKEKSVHKKHVFLHSDFKAEILLPPPQQL
ncbi:MULTISPECIES: hypothetical protein [Flavobacteriaceae]|uniref:hypothetical protein n=1 Tax=Flavobacteriaceae TaxID=49546 RepID=UPI0014914C07|nr:MULTISPECIES: hypothetical protein [Allomuricauda]MDC6365280.1 hypothetical protein [Muricauda sp. AC10]